jgi:thymidylate synthase
MIARNYTNHIREEFKFLLENEIFVTDKTGVKMLEIRGANFIADEKSIFGTVNDDYVQRELEWYKSLSLNVNDIPGGPPAIWKQVADKDGYINSNYGWCVWSKDNNFQYNNVLNELVKNPDSRRAIMIYTNPRMWYKYNENGRSDFMCTNAVQYMIRSNRLHAIVQMRSNDVVFGYKNDYAWQSYVLDMLCMELGVQRGDITWQVGSLHVYERHFNLVV